MYQDGRACPGSSYLLLLLETVGLSLRAPALLTSTLSVALMQSTRIGLVSGHAQPRCGNQSGGSMGQESKLSLQDQTDLVSA